jgi:hypothetical protein
MHRANMVTVTGWVACVALAGLAGCGQVVPAETTSQSGSEPAAPAGSAPSAIVADASPVASAAPMAGEIAVSSMYLAEPPQKLGAPVDLRYQFEGDVKSGLPVTLHLAVVPRVAGSNLVVSVKKESGISTTAGDLTAQKATASTAYRQELSVTKLAGGPSELHVLVMMETPQGSAHSWFNIPFDRPPPASKQQPVKLE